MKRQSMKALRREAIVLIERLYLLADKLDYFGGFDKKTRMISRLVSAVAWQLVSITHAWEVEDDKPKD